jgi:hypothetical protein
MLDPIVHAALVTVFAWLVQMLFNLLGLDLGGETATGLAQVIVAYILSLFGYALYVRATATARGIAPDSGYHYVPPFTR